MAAKRAVGALLVESEQVFEVGKLGMDVDVHVKLVDWKFGRQKAPTKLRHATISRFESVPAISSIAGL